MQVPPDKADDELVIVGVQTVASKADVVRKILSAVRHADLSVLTEDLRLLVLLQAGKGGRAS